MFQMIAAGASILGGILGARQADKAAKRQESLTREGMALQQKRYNEAKSFLRPYTRAGEDYLGYMGDMMGLGGQEGQASALERYKSGPSYSLLQDVISNATDEVKSRMAAGGLLRSGAYGQELTQKISPIILQDYYNYRNAIERGAGQGRAAAGALAGQATQQGGREAQGYSDMGAIQAAGMTAGNNQIQQGVQNALGFLGHNQRSQGYLPAWNKNWSTSVSFA